MASLIVCTPGGATDNCYVTLAQADAVFANTLRQEAWEAWGATDRERALIQATAEIELLGGPASSSSSPAKPRFAGSPYDADTQIWHFPRVADVDEDLVLHIPEGIRRAVCEQAFWLLRQRDEPPLIDHEGLRQAGVMYANIDGIQVNYRGNNIQAGICPAAWAAVRVYVRQGARTRTR